VLLLKSLHEYKGKCTVSIVLEDNAIKYPVTSWQFNLKIHYYLDEETTKGTVEGENYCRNGWITFWDGSYSPLK